MSYHHDVNLEVRHFSLVKAVVEEGSLTRAAERLHLTQSALSHQLRELEIRLGTPLFHRIRKKMVLTSAGSRVLDAAGVVLNTIQTTEADLREDVAGVAGRLRLATECYTCYHWLPPVLARFSELYPRVTVDIDVESTRHPLPALLSGRIDLAIVCERVRGRGFRVTPLFEDELVVIMSPDHPKAGRRTWTAGDFAGQHLITHRVSREDSTVFRHVLTPAGVSPARWSQFDLTEAIVQLVASGYGISVLARWAVAPQLKSGALMASRLTARGLRRQWSCVTLNSKREPSYLEDFRGMLGKIGTNPVREIHAAASR